MLDVPQLQQLSAIDQKAMRTVIEGLIDAWHRGDAVAFAAAFTDNAEFYNVFAHKLEGRAAIERHHAQLFAGIYRGPASATSRSRCDPRRHRLWW